MNRPLLLAVPALIATFRYIQRHPESISGELRLSHALVLSMSAAQTLVLLLPLAVVASATRNDVALGAFFGAGVLSLVHLVWLRRARSARQPAQPEGDHGA